MFNPYVFIDDSTDQVYEEEEFYQEEEEENFNHCTNQGKLALYKLTMQVITCKPSLTMQANPCKLDNLSKGIRHALVIPFLTYTYSKFYLQALLSFTSPKFLTCL